MKAQFFLVAPLLAVTAAQAQDALSASALRDWYSGVSVDGQTERGASFRAYHNADGSIKAIVDGQHKNSGTWKVQEPGHVCVSWDNAAWGKNPCYLVVKDGELWKIVRVDNPNMFTRVKRLEGNPFSF